MQAANGHDLGGRQVVANNPDRLALIMAISRPLHGKPLTVPDELFTQSLAFMR